MNTSETPPIVKVVETESEFEEELVCLTLTVSPKFTVVLEEEYAPVPFIWYYILIKI